MTSTNENPRGLPVVAWRWRDRATLHYLYLDGEPHYSNKEPLVLATDYAALQAEAGKLRADAARYRWLRESGLEIAWNAQVSYSPGYEHGDAEMMEAAIDAAISAMEGRDDGLVSAMDGKPELRIDFCD